MSTRAPARSTRQRREGAERSELISSRMTSLFTVADRSREVIGVFLAGDTLLSEEEQEALEALHVALELLPEPVIV